MPRGSAQPPIDALGWTWHERGTRRERGACLACGTGNAATGASRQRTSAFLRLCGATLAVGALALFCGFLAFVAMLARQERPPENRADGIVALTGGAQRIGDAIDLLAGGYGRRLLITGVNERTSREEIARLNPTQRALIACCVDLDYRARNTIGNAIETRRWMRAHRFGTVAVVTSNYHMPRTLIELDHALQESERVVAHPVVAEGFDADSWWRSPPAARLLASEYVKFLAAWVRTRFEADPERSRAAILIGRGKPVKAPVRMVAEPLIASGMD